jgi:hypothetical protein
MATSSDYEQRTLLQADRLLTQACENKKMLLENGEDILPYAFKTMIQKSTQEREIAEAHLSSVISANQSARSPKNKEATLMAQTHRSFNSAAERLIKSSSKLNKSLSSELEQIQ